MVIASSSAFPFRQDHGKYVAAETAERITGVQHFTQAFGGHDQDAISHFMSHGVVDQLETVDAEKKYYCK